MRYSRGYTLLEMMVTVSIIAITLGMAVPSYRNLTQNESISSAANQLLGAMRFARSEAVKRKAPVKLCASNGGQQCAGVAGNWVNGWLIYVDSNDDDVFNDLDVLLKVMHPESDNFSIAPDAVSFESSVTFFAKGEVLIASKFAFCDDRGEEFGRNLSLSLSGRAKVGERGNVTCL